MDCTKFDMIVIGGGVAGLSSVLHLLNQHFGGRIALLEARDCLGGRIRTTKTKIEEEKIEIGANWIHGIIDNPVYNILYRKGKIDPLAGGREKEYNIQARCIDGQEINSYWIKKVYDVYSSITKKADLLAAKRDDSIIENCRDSMGAYIDQEFRKWMDVEVKDEQHRTIVSGLYRSLVNRENCITGSHTLDEVSLQYIGTYQQFLGGHLTIPRGYYCFIESLLEDIEIKCNESKLKDKFQIFKQTMVTNIEWPGVGEQMQTNNEGGENAWPITIRTSGGETFMARNVIVTLPLGYLKKHARSMFQPALPGYKLDCIDRMGFGVVDKVFLEYASKSTIANLFRNDGGITDEMMLLWNISQDSSSDRPWYTKVYSIYYVSDHCLQLWATGHEALKLESLNEDQINNQITEQFRKFFNDPNFARADNVIVTRWGQDEHTLGSYSFITKASCPKDIEHLEMPIYCKPDDSLPIIGFAGEATHLDYYSTVHGAFLSGQAVAKHFKTSSD